MERILVQKYEILRLIGEGGAGKVYLARDRHLNRLVAIKESKEKISLAEMELLKELEHPGLPGVYDYFKEQESVFLVMEYIEGMTLRQYLNRHKRVSERQAVRWMADLCRILDYMHSRHPAVIYRDLKPENIMIRQDGELKLIDLGGAVRCACGRESLNFHAGTKGYCPREQWKEGRADVSWDIYGLGAVFHEMLTGSNPTKPPYERRFLSEYDKSLPGRLEKIIEHCTGDNGAEKYRCMAQLDEALLNYQEKSLVSGLWLMIRKLVLTVFVLKTSACFCFPLISGISEKQFPFPYLIKPLFFLVVTLFLYLIFFKLKFKRNFLRRQEKNIWLTGKQFSGLLSLVAILYLGAAGIGLFCIASPAAYAGGELEQLWVEMRDEYGRKMLLKNDSVYITNNCVRFELPADRLPDEEISLQMVAVGEAGKVYSSRIFRIRGQEDLN